MKIKIYANTEKEKIIEPSCFGLTEQEWINLSDNDRWHLIEYWDWKKNEKCVIEK